MDKLLYLLQGGFLKGQRTKLLGTLMILQAFVSYLLGDITLVAFAEQLPELLLGAGLWTLRDAVKDE